MDKTENKEPKEGFINKLKKSRAFWALMYILTGTLFLGGIFMILREYVLLPTPYEPPPAPTATVLPAPTPTLAPSATPAPTPLPTPYIKKIPIRIYFTDLERKADIYPVGVAKDGSMDTLDSALDAAWYEFGPSPGEEGNALLNGHVRWKGSLGTFSILREMELKSEAVIEFDDGSFKYFEAVSHNVYLLDDIPPEVMDLEGESRLTLITCKGDFDRKLGTSRSRVVVVFKEKPGINEAPKTQETA